MVPQRAISFVVYLTTSAEGDGRTVFPLAGGGRTASDVENEGGGNALPSLREWWQQGLVESTAEGSDSLQE